MVNSSIHRGFNYSSECKCVHYSSKSVLMWQREAVLWKQPCLLDGTQSSASLPAQPGGGWGRISLWPPWLTFCNAFQLFPLQWIRLTAFLFTLSKERGGEREKVAEEMFQWLKTVAALPKDLCLVLAPIGCSQLSITSIPKTNSLFWHFGPEYRHDHTY